MRKLIHKYKKKRKSLSKYSGFTLIEIILVIAILAAMFIMVLYQIRPIEVLTKVFRANSDTNINALEDAIQDYTLQNQGNLPPVFDNLESGTYTICTPPNYPCGTNSISLEDLVNEGYLPQIPTNPDYPDSPSTGYQIIYNEENGTIEVSESDTTNWGDTNYAYRKKVEISNLVLAQTNYQIPVTFDTQVLINSNKLQSNCNDLKVTNESNDPIQFWIEPGSCGTPITKIWTKHTYLPAGISNIYIYYGNSSIASSATTPSNIFIREVNDLIGFWDHSISDSYPGAGNTWYDLSGNNRNFVHTQTPTWTLQNGFYFNNNGHFTGPSSAVFPQGSDARSAFGIANPDHGISPYGHVFHYGTPAQYRSFGIAINNSGVSSHTWSSQCVAGSWTVDTDNTIVTTSSGSLQQIYKNGVLIGSCNSYTLNTGSSNPSQIGVRIGESEPWVGYIKNVQFYSKVLSAAEILDMTNNKTYATTNYPGTTLVHKYVNGISINGIGEEETI